ncbi:MAG: hypothetical protein K8T26_11320 [Lentisphaerae bacterium]|nr:hypothetical protein [Lentisphaerota bacterium]
MPLAISLPDAIPPPAAAVGDVLNGKVVVPDANGIYFWFFRDLEELLPEALLRGLVQAAVPRSGDHWCCYVGLAAGQTIHTRILEKHLGDNAHVSTLRHTIGSLLATVHGVTRESNPVGGFWAIAPSFSIENRITKFLLANGKLSWQVTNTSAATEKEVLANQNFVLPLNNQCHGHNPIRRLIRNIRVTFKNG